MLAPHGTLCESCGYSLADLAVSAACPECGRPIAHSTPDHRKGSPWQNTRDWWATYIEFLRSPSSLFANIRIESSRSDALARRNAAAASIIIGVSGLIAGGLISLAAGRLTQGSVRFQSGATISLLRPTGFSAAVFSFAPILVNLIDARLTPRLYRILYKWPISSTSYRAARGHASFAWLFFALALSVFVISEPFLLRYASRLNNLNLARLVQTFGTFAVLLGALYVAWLHHVGVKACRYATEPATPAASTEPVASHS
jgi:predicted RNA-binding Zn-ribbon protein involved in translation (DUF1610 family)